MIKRWMWIVASIFISTGVYFTIRYGLRPKPIPVLNVTEFANAQEIGAVIYRRLRQEIRTEHILLLGSTPKLPGYADIRAGLLKTASADSLKISVVLQREGLKTPVGPWTVTNFTEAMVQSGELVNTVKAAI